MLATPVRSTTKVAARESADLLAVTGVVSPSLMSLSSRRVSSAAHFPYTPLSGSTNDVVWTVTDIHGNSAICTQQVYVLDNQAPTNTCAANAPVHADGGLWRDRGVVLGSPVTNDNCGVSSVLHSPAKPYAVGTNHL